MKYSTFLTALVFFTLQQTQYSNLPFRIQLSFQLVNYENKKYPMLFVDETILDLHGDYNQQLVYVSQKFSSNSITCYGIIDLLSLSGPRFNTCINEPNNGMVFAKIQLYDVTNLAQEFVVGWATSPNILSLKRINTADGSQISCNLIQTSTITKMNSAGVFMTELSKRVHILASTSDDSFIIVYDIVGNSTFTKRFPQTLGGALITNFQHQITILTGVAKVSPPQNFITFFSQPDTAMNQIHSHMTSNLVPTPIQIENYRIATDGSTILMAFLNNQTTTPHPKSLNLMVAPVDFANGLITNSIQKQFFPVGIQSVIALEYTESTQNYYCLYVSQFNQPQLVFITFGVFGISTPTNAFLKSIGNFQLGQSIMRAGFFNYKTLPNSQLYFAGEIDYIITIYPVPQQSLNQSYGMIMSNGTDLSQFSSGFIPQGEINPFVPLNSNINLVFYDCLNSPTSPRFQATINYTIGSGPISVSPIIQRTNKCFVNVIFQNENGVEAPQQILFQFRPDFVDINVTDQSHAGLYNLTQILSINGTNLTSSTTFFLNIIAFSLPANTPSSCLLGKITPIPVPDMIYYTGSGLMSFSFQEWTHNIPSCNPVIYTSDYPLNTGTVSLDNLGFINLNPYKREYSIYTNEVPLQPEFSIRLNGTARDQSSFIFIRVAIRKGNLYAPSFKTSLQSVSVEAGNDTKITLPGIEDLDGDSWLTPLIIFGKVSFASGNYPTFTLNPQLFNVGEYTVSIILTDAQPDQAFKPKSATYSFKIAVTARNQSSNQISNNFNIYSIRDRSKKPSSRIKITGPLIAKIASISPLGIITVDFNQDVIVPLDYPNFVNEKTIQINIQLGTYDIQGESDFSWKVTSFSVEEMTIQLNFVNPLQVVQNYLSIASIKFLKTGLFTSDWTGNTINASSTTNSMIIPRQMKLDRASNALVSTSSYVKAIIGTSVYGSFIFNLLMSTSMQFLWGMVNVMQVLCTAPLFNLNFPANAQYGLGLITQVSNFDILPTSTLYSAVFDFSDNSSKGRRLIPIKDILQDQDSSLTQALAGIDIFKMHKKSSILNFLTNQTQ